MKFNRIRIVLWETKLAMVLLGLMITAICGLVWWGISHEYQKKIRIDRDAYHQATSVPSDANPTDHITALRNYLTEFPHGSFAQEASESLQYWNKELAERDCASRCGNLFRQQFWESCYQVLNDDQMIVLTKLGRMPDKVMPEFIRLSNEINVFLGLELHLQIPPPETFETVTPDSKSKSDVNTSVINSAFEFEDKILKLARSFAEKHGRILVETREINPRLVITLVGEHVGQEYLYSGDTKVIRKLRKVTLSVSVQDDDVIIWQGEPSHYTDEAAKPYYTPLTPPPKCSCVL